MTDIDYIRLLKEKIGVGIYACRWVTRICGPKMPKSLLDCLEKCLLYIAYALEKQRQVLFSTVKCSSPKNPDKLWQNACLSSALLKNTFTQNIHIIFIKLYNKCLYLPPKFKLVGLHGFSDAKQ